MPVKRRKPDQYLLRLPEGLRDRIQAYADRHERSLNAEIVRVLEREFPPTASIDAQVSELLGLLDLLREGKADEFFGRFSEELFSTLVDVANGRTKVDEETRSHVAFALEQWRESELKERYHDYTAEMDEEEVEALHRTGRPTKYVHTEDEDPFPDPSGEERR